MWLFPVRAYCALPLKQATALPYTHGGACVVVTYEDSLLFLEKRPVSTPINPGGGSFGEWVKYMLKFYFVSQLDVHRMAQPIFMMSTSKDALRKP